MKIKIKLFATLSRYLPAGASGNQLEMHIAHETSAQQMIDRLSLPPELTHMVLVNGFYIPPEERARRLLEEDDELAVWPPIAGG